jgi:hypothetical protein
MTVFCPLQYEVFYKLKLLLFFTLENYTFFKADSQKLFSEYARLHLYTSMYFVDFFCYYSSILRKLKTFFTFIQVIF